MGYYGKGDSGMNVPLTSQAGFAQLSPYLNINPDYIQTQPEFITLEGASQKRGRFELAFSQIGGSCMFGGAIGGAQGFHRGLLETAAAGHTGKIRRTQMLNYVMKRGAANANALGVIAVMYSSIGCLLSLARENEDNINTVVAGTLTGLLFKSTSGAKKCGIGGLVGLGLSGLFIAFSSRDRFKEQYNQRF